MNRPEPARYPEPIAGQSVGAERLPVVLRDRTQYQRLPHPAGLTLSGNQDTNPSYQADMIKVSSPVDGAKRQ
jgi:hypothetical protein